MGRFPLGKNGNLFASCSTKDYLTLCERSLRTLAISDPTGTSTRPVDARGKCVAGGQNSYWRVGDRTCTGSQYVSVGAPWRSGFCPQV